MQLFFWPRMMVSQKTGFSHFLDSCLRWDDNKSINIREISYSLAAFYIHQRLLESLCRSVDGCGLWLDNPVCLNYLSPTLNELTIGIIIKLISGSYKRSFYLSYLSELSKVCKIKPSNHGTGGPFEQTSCDNRCGAGNSFRNRCSGDLAGPMRR